jgi:hypothetical protein
MDFSYAWKAESLMVVVTLSVAETNRSFWVDYNSDLAVKITCDSMSIEDHFDGLQSHCSAIMKTLKSDWGKIKVKLLLSHPAL